MKSILVTGARGQLGREIRAQKDMLHGVKFYFSDIDDLDIRDEAEVFKIIDSIKPSLLINCAAYTSVDRAETEPEDAFAVNSMAVKNIITAAARKPGMKIIHISTDFVFDGNRKTPYTEDINPSAMSAYGKSKQEGEGFALSYPLSMIIRTSWLYSEYGKNFVKTVLGLATEKDEIKVVDDQVGSPTWAADLASTILLISGESFKKHGHFANGIYHYSNQGSCSWYDFAMEIKRIKGLNINIKPVGTDDYPLPAKRPAYSVLNLEKIKNTYNIDIPYWQDSLEKCLNRINH